MWLMHRILIESDVIVEVDEAFATSIITDGNKVHATTIITEGNRAYATSFKLLLR